MIFRKLREKINNMALRQSEKVWNLYDAKPEFEIFFSYPFIDLHSSSGHFNCNIFSAEEKIYAKGIICVNLHKYVTKETIINVINHEVLHITICGCLKNGARTNFIEKVIDKWLLNTLLVRRNWKELSVAEWSDELAKDTAYMVH